MAPTAIAHGYPTVAPYLMLNGARRFVDFFTAVFGARVQEHITKPDGAIGHAEVWLDASVIMLSEATDAMPANPTMLHVYVPDVDAAYERAIAAGGVALRPVRDEFYGDRAGGIREPCGNAVWIATHIEDVSPEALAQRAAAAAQG